MQLVLKTFQIVIELKLGMSTIPNTFHMPLRQLKALFKIKHNLTSEIHFLYFSRYFRCFI